MNRLVRVHLLPALFEPHELRECLAVVIDVLRATTTMACALQAGAARIIPCGEIDEAQQIAARLPPDSAVLGGERGGLKIPGFHLGNSPAEYTPRSVGGKTVVFTTTNGTRALLRARQARRLVTAAFVNLNPVVQWLAQETGPVHIVCAGTDGRITLEDTLCAGTLVRGLTLASSGWDLSDDAAALALDLSQNRLTNYDRFVEALRDSRGGRNLLEHGLGDDIAAAARYDIADLVPELSRDPWQLAPAAELQVSPRRFVEPPRTLRV